MYNFNSVPVQLRQKKIQNPPQQSTTTKNKKRKNIHT